MMPTSRVGQSPAKQRDNPLHSEEGTSLPPPSRSAKPGREGHFPVAGSVICPIPSESPQYHSAHTSTPLIWHRALCRRSVLYFTNGRGKQVVSSCYCSEPFFAVNRYGCEVSRSRNERPPHTRSSRRAVAQKRLLYPGGICIAWVVAAFLLGAHSPVSATLVLIGYPAWDALAN
jgi:hypothetical protein